MSNCFAGSYLDALRKISLIVNGEILTKNVVRNLINTNTISNSFLLFLAISL
jgi:hypothetical protein